jgi:hypothetical protein
MILRIVLKLKIMHTFYYNYKFAYSSFKIQFISGNGTVIPYRELLYITHSIYLVSGYNYKK